MTDDNDLNYRRLREFLRIPTDICVEMVCVSQDGHIPEEFWTPAEMSELGGGGAKIAARLKMSAGDVVCVRFIVPDTDEIMKLYGRIVDAIDRKRTDGASTGTATACIKFVGFPESERGKILRYMFREQIRRARQKVEVGTETGEGTEHEDSQ